MVCNIYFWARVVHVFAYTFGVPWIRTLAFLAGWISCVALLLELI